MWYALGGYEEGDGNQSKLECCYLVFGLTGEKDEFERAVKDIRCL